MIYLFHKVDKEVKSLWWVTSDFFEDFLIKHPEDLITFDGIYRNAYKYALPILRKYKRKAIWFFTESCVGGDNKFDSPEPLTEFCNWKELCDISQDQELGWHCFSHFDLTEIDDYAIKKQVEPPFPMKHLAYPYGNFNNRVVEEAKKHFKYGYACENGNYNNLTLKRQCVFQSTC